MDAKLYAQAETCHMHAAAGSDIPSHHKITLWIFLRVARKLTMGGGYS